MPLANYRPTEFHLYLYGPDRGPIPASFDAAADRLQRLPRLCFEPDGSFAWSPDPTAELFGMLYDAAAMIQYVELRGCCHFEQWKAICQAITGDGSAELTILQLPERDWHDLQSFAAERWPGDGE